MKLVCDKKTEYVLLIPKGKDEFIDFAVKELNDVIEKSTGVRFPIVETAGKNFISIGNTDALKNANITTTYGDDGFAVKEKDGNLYLFGQSENGAIWAVYEFLERTVGYRFYAKDEVKIEKRTEIDITGLDFEYTPTITYRGSGFGLPKDEYEYPTRLKAYAYYGIRLDGKDIWGSWAHNLASVFIQPEKYYEDHPEWFFHLDGEKDVKKMRGQYNQAIRMQLCLSNQEMRNEFAKNLIEHIKKNDHATYFLLGREDNDGFCECENCKKITDHIGESGLYMEFVNDMARRVEKWRKESAPERTIYIGALVYECGYGKVDSCFVPPVKVVDGKYVPKDPCVVAEPNVFVLFCAMTQPEHSKSVYCEANKNMLDIMNRWHVVVDHYCGYIYYGTFRRGFEFVDGIYRFKEDIEYYKQNGCKYFFVESPNQKAFHKMTLYVLTKLMWDITLDTDDLIEEFCDNYYKVASPYVKKYFRYMMDYCSKTRERIQYLTGLRADYGMCLTDTVPYGYWSLNAVYDASLMLDDAEKAIDESDLDEQMKNTLHDRIELERMVLIYIQLEYFNREMSEYEEARTINCYPKEKILELCDRFEKGVKKFGIKFVNGDGTPEEVINGWRNRAIKTARGWEQRIYLIHDKFNKK
jgi:hypothetical protein